MAIKKLPTTKNPWKAQTSKQIFDNAPLFFDDVEETGSGTTSTYVKAKASTTLAVIDHTH